jgi:hypothetical protein
MRKLFSMRNLSPRDRRRAFIARRRACATWTILGASILPINWWRPFSVAAMILPATGEQDGDANSFEDETNENEYGCDDNGLENSFPNALSVVNIWPNPNIPRVPCAAWWICSAGRTGSEKEAWARSRN